ncbi:MAG: carbohydrate ABC transporter permease [Euzebyales bacterium]|nr:carbohydrate ABC transporter permease [Euzebyales bacterium]
MSARALIGRLAFYLFTLVVGVFFALPLLWLLSAPFDADPTLSVAVPSFTLANFAAVFDNPFVATSLRNSIILALGTMALVVASASLCSYALSRVRLPGRDLLLYVLLLFSSVVSGTAAMVPLFQLVNRLGLIDTHVGVVLVLTGGLLPAGIFILKDFMDSIPASYEEFARVAGASSLQTLRDVVLPIARPGLAVVAVWAIVNVWGDFLIPFILLRSPGKAPAAVVMFNFYTEGGQANLRLISAYSFLYSIPVVVMYLFVNRRYGFRFYGGIKR